ncbi:MAG: hypothetical protein R2828_04770 [Saprospiraceae bacterium]
MKNIKGYEKDLRDWLTLRNGSKWGQTRQGNKELVLPVLLSISGHPLFIFEHFFSCLA